MIFVKITSNGCQQSQLILKLPAPIPETAEHPNSKNMKQIILSFLFAIFCLGLKAQQNTFEIIPNPSDNSFFVDWNDLYETQTCTTRVKNTSGQKKTLRWAIEVINAPAGWKFSACDQNDCYHSFNNSNVDLSDGYPNAPVVLLPGDTSRLWLNVFPAGKTGTAEVRINLYDMGNPTSPLNAAIYKVTISEATPLTEAERSRLRIFPNPVSDYMTLTSNTFVKQLRVSNILGKQLRTFDANPAGRYDISDLPDGMYLVSMVDANHKIVKTVRVSKRGIRP